MAHGDVVAKVDAIFLLHAVQDAVVLNIGIVTNADLVDIAAEDGVHPDAGMFADDDVADELGGVVDVGSFGELGSDAFEGPYHGFIRCWKSSSGPITSRHGRRMSVRLMNSQHTMLGTAPERREHIVIALIDRVLSEIAWLHQLCGRGILRIA